LREPGARLLDIRKRLLRARDEIRDRADAALGDRKTSLGERKRPLQRKVAVGVEPFSQSARAGGNEQDPSDDKKQRQQRAATDHVQVEMLGDGERQAAASPFPPESPFPPADSVFAGAESLFAPSPLGASLLAASLFDVSLLELSLFPSLDLRESVT